MIDLNNISFERVGEIIPKGGSGTGYCEYVKLRIHYNNHKSSEVLIDNWYTDKHQQLEQLRQHLSDITGLYYINLSVDVITEFFNSLT